MDEQRHANRCKERRGEREREQRLTSLIQSTHADAVARFRELKAEIAGREQRTELRIVKWAQQATSTASAHSSSAWAAAQAAAAAAQTAQAAVVPPTGS